MSGQCDWHDAEHSGDLEGTRDIRVGEHRPVLPERLRARFADAGGGDVFPAPAPRGEVRLLGAARPDQPRLREADRPLRARGRHRRAPLHQGRAQGRRDAAAPAHLHRVRRGLYLGTAQEKFTTVRTEKRCNPATGRTFPWLVRASVLAKVYYWYVVDEDFGPLFIKFGSYFPYPVKVCLNGHEFLLRQLAKRVSTTSHWTTAFSPAPMRRWPRASPPRSTSGPSRAYSRSGWRACRIPFPRLRFG